MGAGDVHGGGLPVDGQAGAVKVGAGVLTAIRITGFGGDSGGTGGKGARRPPPGILLVVAATDATGFCRVAEEDVRFREVDARVGILLRNLHIELIHKRWQYSMVLVGLTLLHEDRQQRKANHNGNNSSNDLHVEAEDGGTETIEDKVAKVSTALAPVLLPMIDSLGSLDVGASETVSVSAEAK